MELPVMMNSDPWKTLDDFVRDLDANLFLLTGHRFVSG
jgi:hypothetical protein